MISIHIPKEGNAPDITKEMSSAKRIKDRVTRQTTLTGLTKISHYL